MTDRQYHEEADDRNAPGVDAGRYDTFDDSSVLLDDGEALVRKLEADDREFAKEFFRSRRRFAGGVDR